jgi:hypothetical protein
MELTASLGPFDAGVNAGVSPLILPDNQLASATNATVRGTYVRQRPCFRRIAINSSDGAIKQAATKAYFQGATYFAPDNQPECLVAAIGGRLFRFVPSDFSADVSEHTVAGDPNPADRPQAWLWQAEKWVIWNDGLSRPVFFDGTVSFRSNWNTPLSFSTATATNPLVVPAIGSTTVATPTFADTSNMEEGDILTFQGIGQFLVQSVDSPTTATLVNVNASPTGKTIPVGTIVTWQHIGEQLPPGRMGTYGLGRNWVSLVDGKQFIASDLVGGSSGTIAEGFRDAVLYVTENSYLAGGGNFTVPGSVGDIQAMRFTATLDASLGQGPLQVFTYNTVFSCNAPVDRASWQDLVNPILTESLIASGAVSQNATVNVNGDLTFRSVDGLRSLILARREFSTWGNTPISREVQPLLDRDEPSALSWASAIVFDNRLLVTASPSQHELGVYFRAIVPLNFDALSSLRGKAPAVYDSLAWSGLNVLQLVTGNFNRKPRAFAFTLNTTTSEIELYEILTTDAADYDNDNSENPVSVVWTLETPAMFRYAKDDPRSEAYKRLSDGEIFVDQLKGEVVFQAFWRPDQWPCWIPWHHWKECAAPGDDGATRPQFRPRMGLGEPPSLPCDETNNRPLREGYTFQFKLIITGRCRLLGIRLKADTIPQPKYARPNCCLSDNAGET